MLTGCSTNSQKLDEVPDVEISEVSEIEYPNEQENEYYNKTPNVEFSTDNNIEYSKVEKKTKFLNNLLNIYRDMVSLVYKLNLLLTV